MVRPTGVCVSILSTFALLSVAVLLLLRTSVRLFGRFESRVLLRKCKGMSEYVRKLPFSPLGREVLFALVCSALESVGGLSNRAPAAFDRGTLIQINTNP